MVELLLHQLVHGRQPITTLPRSIEITVPSSRTSGLLEELQKLDGIWNLGLRPGGSVRPPGDIITVQCGNGTAVKLVSLLDAHGVGKDAGTGFSSSVPASVVTPEAAPVVTRDSSDSSWEEVELMLTRESHLTANSACIMFVAGFTAAAGIASGALHIVAAAMVIAPGFEPFVRIALGWITSSDAWKRGLRSAVLGYLAMIAGSIVASLLVSRTGTSLLTGTKTYESTETLVRYWTSFTVPSVSVSIMAGVAGALLVISHRSVLTAGVMIALALVPTASLIGVALVAQDLQVMAQAALRFGAEALIVVLTALLVFLGKRLRGRRARMML